MSPPPWNRATYVRPGPLVANFHLHHKIPQYRRNPLAIVYFLESGSKVWLVGYLTGVALALPLLSEMPALAWLLIYVGILSSVAESRTTSTRSPAAFIPATK